MSYQITREYVHCADGFNMSVQASKTHYCSPRVDGHEAIYRQVEVGFPSEHEPLLDKYIEGLLDREEDWTGSVYCWVPSEIVALVIAKHGGMVSGELPRLGFINIIPILRKEKNNEDK